jgi:NADH-quinone oxidoreductase subunit F
MNLLEKLAVVMSEASLCGLGQAAPTPVLTSMKHFSADYKAVVNSEMR